MGGAEFYSVVNFSLVLGAIVGALLCICLQSAWNSLTPGESAVPAGHGLRAKIAWLQQALRSDTSYAPPSARKEASVGLADSPVSITAGPASAFLDALWAFLADESVASAKHPHTLAAGHRIEKPMAPALCIVPRPRPAETETETETVAPIRRRLRGTESPRVIDTRMVQEIVLRHFGVTLCAMPLGLQNPSPLPLRQELLSPAAETARVMMVWNLPNRLGTLRHGHRSSNHTSIGQRLISGAPADLNSWYRSS
ncbi:MAG: hypothetical protein ABSE21_09570 [Bryobacteraceae bacterium]|jgi:hypothetical protein